MLIELDRRGVTQAAGVSQFDISGSLAANGRKPTNLLPPTPQKTIVTHVIPKNAITCMSGNVTFLAPPSFNPAEIAAAGRAGGLSGAGRAVAQYGAFDYQRTTNSSGQQVNVAAYADVSNFAVGLYVGGAGYSSEAATIVNDLYAAFKSSNGSTLQQAAFRDAGINAANGAPVSCSPPR